MRVLVTGASGFLGRRLVGQLRAEGCDVTAVGRAASAKTLVDGGSRLLALDLAAAGELPEPEPHDVAFLLAQSGAYRGGLERAADVLAVNLVGLARSLDLARRAGVRRVFCFSSGSVYRPSFEPLREEDPVSGDGLYPMSKRMGEELARGFDSEFEVVVIRPFILYGPGQRDRLVPDLVSRVVEGRAVTLEPRAAGELEPSGLVVTPCHVDDAARISVSLLERELPATLNLAGPERLSIRGVAEAVGRAVGRDPVFEVLSGPRQGDFVADGTLLAKAAAPEFRPFEEGLAELLVPRASR